MEEIFLGKRDPVDRESANINKYNITGTTITRTAGNRGDLLMVPVMEAARTFSFSFKILKREGEWAMHIGIMSRCQIKEE